ncbi:MAG: long-chain fatty acid--CoA ligase [Saprospiraceae bacterium]
MQNITRAFDCIFYQQKNFPLKEAFNHRLPGSNEWTSYSTEQIITNSQKMAGGLLNLGLQKGDKIALISYKNRPEWTIMDLAAQQLGIITVPVYPTISSSDYDYIFNDAEVKYAFVGTGDLYDKVIKAKANIPTLIDTYTFDQQPNRKYYEDLSDESKKAEVAKIAATVQPTDVVTFIYTSGTTGNPKGVVLTHNNLVHVVKSTISLLPTEAGNQVLSFLPMCHIFERTVSYSYMAKSAKVYFTGTDNLGGPSGDLQAVKPYFFTTVPRLLEKVYEKIYNTGLTLTGFKKKLFFWALSLTDDYNYDKKYAGLSGIKQSIADKLIYSKWRAALGGNVNGIVTGAAPCPVKIMRVFSAAGIPIREGYGLTETSPSLTVNAYEPGAAMMGTVGRPIEGVDILIDRSEGEYRDGEGEILAFGPNIMQGYYNKPAKNAEVFKDIDGKVWFKTGDIGKMVKGPGGHDFLKITDRKKELLKTSGGKYVAPAPIENKFKEDFLIEQMMVVGEKRKFVSAVLVPSAEALQDWCKQNGVPFNSLDEVCKNEKVIARYQEIINQFNPLFSHIEQIKKFTLLPTTWDAVKEDGSKPELTPTMKLKRRVVREKFEKEISAMYS